MPDTKVLDYLGEQLHLQYLRINEYVAIEKFHEAYCLGREAIVIHQIYTNLGGDDPKLLECFEPKRTQTASLEVILKIPHTIISTLSEGRRAAVLGHPGAKLK